MTTDKRKITPKQDHFCRVYIETGNASEAYRQAYDAEKSNPNTIRVKAYELLKTPKVAARIEQLRAGHVNRHNVTVDSLTNEYETARAKAESNDNPAVMVSATTGKARIHGLLAEDRVNERDPIKDMSGEELKNRIDELLEKR